MSLDRIVAKTGFDLAIADFHQCLSMGEQKAMSLLSLGEAYLEKGQPSHALAETPLRGSKGTMYEGGIRVPGVIEWPARIPQPRASRLAAVTSDILPTVCHLAGQALPKSPLDGVNLEPLIDGRMNVENAERRAQAASPICSRADT